MDEINKTLLTSSLEVAIPLWIETFKDYDWDEFKRIVNDSENVLSECAEAVLFRVEGKSAKAFNALAKAIAVLSYCPGGIEIFGMRFTNDLIGLAAEQSMKLFGDKNDGLFSAACCSIVEYESFNGRQSCSYYINWPERYSRYAWLQSL